MNDISMMLLQSHSGAKLSERGAAQIIRLRQKSATIPHVMTDNLHRCITGAPYRITMLEKLLACVQSRPGVLIQAAINDGYHAQVPAPV